MLLRSTLSLLVFCLLDLSVSYREVLKSLALIVQSSIPLCNTIGLGLMWVAALLSYEAVVKERYFFVENQLLNYYIMSFFNPAKFP